MDATLRVALPGWVGAGRQRTWATALDVSALVEEWALVLLDPVEGLARVAPAALKQPGWDLTGKATVTPAVMKLVRDAACEPQVERAVAEAVGPGKMTLQGACLMLGLAAVAALDANVGKAAAVTLADLKKRLADLKKRKAATDSAAAKRERQRSAPAAARAEAARPTLASMTEAVAPDERGERPILTEMAADLWGIDVR